ncbi:MAG: hypothetical protein U1F65_11740 [Verrucomicrobiota bacterium]
MKNLILDYLRRKWWILAIGVVAELFIGWFGAADSKGAKEMLSSFQVQLGVFMGAFLLSFDLQRGIGRTVATLPVTTAQVARAWWHSTVSIPAAGLSALLFLGATAFKVFHPQAAVNWSWLALCSVFLFLWSGTGFVLIVGSNDIRDDAWWRQGIRMLMGAAWGGMIGGGFWFMRTLADNPLRLALLLVITSIGTTIGWSFAERLVMARIRTRAVAAVPQRERGSTDLSRGFGGVTLLLTQTVARSLLMSVVMVLVIYVMALMQGRINDWRHIATPVMKMGLFPLWLMIFFSVLPIFFQLRHLRTLPISTSKLALILMGSYLLPMMIVGAAFCGGAWLSGGVPLALETGKNYVLALMPATTMVVMVVWLGGGILAFILMVLLLTVTQAWRMGNPGFFDLSLGSSAVLLAVVVLTCFWLTRLALSRSSKAYRGQLGALLAQNRGSFG